MSGAPSVGYWRLWVGADGVSRQTRCAMTDFTLKSIQPPADPQWLGEKTSGAMTMMVTVLPVGWIGDWHPNPKPQWILPLSGVWFVESMDGARVEMGPGEISFGGDQHAATVDGRRGHRSGTVGEAPAVLMLVQIDDPPAPPPGETG
ncbi:MAG TPA: hypothetical protein VFC47_09730 [Caulobacteraceae bacterium]|nr:hypothetical protein [Caulobacteraceae bacterium]